jgi:Transglycosylase SLT domain
LSSIPSVIVAAANTNGVPPQLALAVAQQESSLNPNAIGGAGELGLFQLQPSLAESLGLSNPLDPAENAQGGTSYLAQLFSTFGDWATALAAYNWGPGNVAKYGAAAAPASTQSYVTNALATAGIAVPASAPATLLLNSPASAGAPSLPASLPIDTADDSDVIDLAPDDSGVYAPAASGGSGFFTLALVAFGVYLALDFLEG